MRPTFRGIQALRGFAAILVLLFHASGMQFGIDARAPGAWIPGQAGVDLFFVISGFVMAVSATGLSRPSAGEFLKRRFLRIVPLYWIFTLLALAKSLLVNVRPGLGSNVAHVHTPIDYVLASLLFVPWRNSQGEMFPVLPAGWTLSFEMLFYLLFALALKLKVEPIRLLAPTLVALSFLSLVSVETWPAFLSLLSPLLLEFLAGLALGYAFRAGRRLPDEISLGLGVLGLGLLLTIFSGGGPWLRVLECGVPALLVVQAAVMLEAHWGKHVPLWMLKAGDASYSLYLVHIFVLLGIARIVFTLRLQRPNESLIAGVCLVVSVLVSLGVRRYVEEPILRFGMRGLGAPRGSSQPPFMPTVAG